MKVPGISDTLASKIVEYRESHGQFKNVDELEAVEGFSSTRKEQFRDVLQV